MPEQRSRPKEGRVIALANQKGGTGKTTTTVNLGIGLARLGQKVLLIDADPQGDLTTCLGWQDQDSLQTTIATIMEKVIRDEPFSVDEGILHHKEGVDLMPANIELSAMEMSLVNAMSREFTLRTYVNEVKKNYDTVLIDCMPSLGMITINALAAADSVIIPVQAHYLPAKGMTQLMRTIGKVRRQINPSLKVDGVLLTLVDGRTNLAKQTAETLRQSYGSVLKIYRSEIPVAIKAAEISAAGKSIYAYDNGSKVAQAYIRLTHLIPDILELVDNSVLREPEVLQIAMRPAVELSYLRKEEQADLFAIMEEMDCTPSHAQAIKMRQMSEAKTGDERLAKDALVAIMKEEKPNQKEQIKIPKERISKYFAPGTPAQKIEDTIVQALELYRRRQRSLER